MSIDRARRLAESAVAALLAERVRNGGRIECDGVSWAPPKTQRPSRQSIRVFLEVALRDGAVAVRDLEARARAEGLLPPNLAISQCAPFRTAARKFKILSFREDDRW
jgi:hypothetical protein